MSPEQKIVEIQEVMPERKADKVAIIGCSGSKTEAPFGQEGWEYWGVNNLCLSMPEVEWTRWFEIHLIGKDATGRWHRRYSDHFRGQPVADYLKLLAGLKNPKTGEPVPVYMQMKWPEVPNGEIFPFQTILSKFVPYFTNSISWQIALALLMDFKTIGVWGVDMATMDKGFGIDGKKTGEYAHQRPSCEWLLGIALGKGVQIIVPDSSDLLKTRFQYALDEPKKQAWDQKRMAWEKELTDRENKDRMRLQQIKQEEEAIIARVNQYKGAKMGLDAVRVTWHHEAGQVAVDNG